MTDYIFDSIISTALFRPTVEGKATSWTNFGPCTKTCIGTRAVEVPKKKAVKKAPLTGASGAF